MKNILVDLIGTQEFFNGCGVYIRKVFFTLLNVVENQETYGDIHIVCVYDSRKRIVYPDLSIEKLSSIPFVSIEDISDSSFGKICQKHDVTTVFLGFGQQIYYYDFSGVDCRVICVLHDIYDMEFPSIKLNEYLRLFKTDNSVVRHIARLAYNFIGDVSKILKKQNEENRYKAHVDLFSNNPNYQIITVSSFSFFSILNLLPFPKEKMKVLWSPEKELLKSDSIENESLKKIIENKYKYLLIVSANREAKNAKKAIDAFKRYLHNNHKDDLFLVTIGFEKSLSPKHIILPYLSDSDIEYAYQNCYALLYPSFFEGFGYPPVEVMKYGKPVLSSNVCSMPEILGGAPIWFSPFYETDIYKAINTLMISDYPQLCQQSYEQYLKIQKKQESDLKELIRIILS